MLYVLILHDLILYTARNIVVRIVPLSELGHFLATIMVSVLVTMTTPATFPARIIAIITMLMLMFLHFRFNGGRPIVAVLIPFDRDPSSGSYPVNLGP